MKQIFEFYVSAPLSEVAAIAGVISKYSDSTLVQTVSEGDSIMHLTVRGSAECYSDVSKQNIYSIEHFEDDFL
jgi:hypothetical protein